MIYSFSVGFDITSASEYSSLSAANRQQTRNDLFTLVQSVVDEMGSATSSDPNADLDSRLSTASSSGQTWTRGAKLDRGFVYEVHEPSGEVICTTRFALESNGLPYQALVAVSGVQLAAKFIVSYSAENGTL
jgi:hypothetical protein